ncbi:hypothetical protein L7F22_038205 [Adiantum nelumboides]|nr:hypothetical protein [Adiantum nelumboides]
MGCGVSKDCIADPSLVKSKKRLIHACREHLHHAISDKQTASAVIVAPHHQYTHLRETPTLDEQGDADDVAQDEHDDDDNIGINVGSNNDNGIHFPVHEEEEHINADEVITINPDDSEYLENRPPASQPLTLPLQNAYARGNAHAASSPGIQKAVHKPPLRELSIVSNGKLDVKKDHLGIFTIHTSSPRSNNNYSYGGISPSRPSAKARSSSCSPLNADKVKVLSPMRAWNPQHEAHTPNFIKSFADHQLCKEVENTESDELKVVGHSYNPLPVTKTSVVEFDGDNQTEELFKSHTDPSIDGFIEDLQVNIRANFPKILRVLFMIVMPHQKTVRQWDKAPYEADDLSTNEKSHIPDEVLAQILAHIFIAKFRDEEGDNIKTTIMPREIWTLHRRPKVASTVRAVHLENFFRLPPWGTDYMRAHELMSSIQYDGKAMLTDNDGAKVEVLITKDIINEALHFIPGAYDLIPKTKAINNEKAFLKVKGSKFKYSDLIYTELELPLRLISQHLRVQKPPRYTEPFLHMAVVMALCVAEKRQVRCDFTKYILESLIEANLKNSAKNKLYMNAGPMLTRIAYQALGMIEDLPAASSQASLIQQGKYVPKAVITTSSAASSKSSKSTRSKKSSSKEERTETDKEQDSQESAHEDLPKETETIVSSEYESDEEDTTVPLERKSQRPRSTEQVLLDEAMARVEARRKELADARAAKAAKKTRPMTMEEARNGTIEYLKKLEREKHTAEQRAAQLAREKIKEALSRKAEEPVLEPTQGSPKRPRQEEEEEIEDIQADPIPPSPINIPPTPPSSPITPFPLASTPQTPPSPLPLETPLSPPAPNSPQQQHLSTETSETPAPLPEETHQPMETQASPQKETAQHMDKVDEEKQLEREQHQPTKVDVPILMVQDEEPTSQEAILEVRSFDYTKLIQTLSRQFQCQQVVAKETEIQKTRANQAQEENANLRTALELATKERESGAKDNENLIRDLMDLQSQLTRKEAQNHKLIKNDKKMKEQLKYKDAKFQKLNASYNTVKNTLTALLQTQEPATAAPSTSDSAALNTLAALQAELQIEKLQRQLLVSGFMSQTAQHKAKVKQLEEELAKAKAELAAMGSLASTSYIQQAKTHVPIQPPQLPEMPEFQGIEEEEQQRPARGALDIREDIEQEIEDLPEGPAKEYLMYEKKVMQSAALAFLQSEEQVKDFGTEFLPLPLMRHEAILWKEKMRPAVPRNEDGGYEGISLTTEEAKTLIEDHPRWRKKWLSERPRDLTNFHNTPQALQIDPTYCPVPRQRTWAEFQKWKGKNKALLNYLVLSAQEPPIVNYVVNILNTTI